MLAKETPVVMDLGFKKEKKIKRLKKGRGSLMIDVQARLEQLSAVGAISHDVQTVIVVVEREPEPAWNSWM